MKLFPLSISDKQLERLLGCGIDQFYFANVLLKFPQFQNVANLVDFDVDGAEILNQANLILEHKFNIFNYGLVRFGENIIWHHSFWDTGTYPFVYRKKLKISRDYDIKYVWELNRHQHFFILCRAYNLTKDEKYAQEFFAELSNWIDDNPVEIGVNWMSSLEAGIRCISWILCLATFQVSFHFTPHIKKKVLKSIILHAQFIKKNLSFQKYPNNHLIGEVASLFVTGFFLSGMEGADSLMSTSLKILEEQLKNQIYYDGVDKEQSVDYHRFVLDFTLLVFVICKQTNIFISHLLSKTLENMLVFLLYSIRPDGNGPMIGDDDSGRAYKFSFHSSRYFLPALSTGAVLFNRGDMKYVAQKFFGESACLLGNAGKEKYEELEEIIPEYSSHAFQAGGYYVMRSGWNADALYLIFDCGPQGMGGAGHGHADALSFELFAYGNSLLVDPGTFTYNGSLKWRNYFRGTSAHNTIVVDRQDQAVCLPSPDPFGWQEKVEAKIHRWETGKYFDLAYGSHDGYKILPEPVIHSRAIFFVKPEYWIITDILTGAGKHRLDLYFHLSSGAYYLSEKSKSFISCHEKNANIVIIPSKPEIFDQVYVVEGRENPIQGWISFEYGKRKPAPVLCYAKEKIDMPVSFSTICYPVPVSEKPLDAMESIKVKEIEPIKNENGGSTVLKIFKKGFIDYYFNISLFNSPPLSVTSFDEFCTDAEVFFMSIGHNRQIRRLVMLNGSYLRENDQNIILAKNHIPQLEFIGSGDILNIYQSDETTVNISNHGYRKYIIIKNSSRDIQ